MLTSFLRKLLNWLRHNFLDLTLILIILGVSSLVAFRNYVPGTWLLGWDDLVPELNFKLNIVRSLSATWQEYQGLGLLGGMAHTADLPRQIFLWISSLIVPTSSLRYLWMYLMLAAGPLGVYFMVSRVFINKNIGFLGRVAGFASAIFYIFNLATVQTFYTPFETFVSFYGFFPWLLFFALDFLRNGGKRKLFTYFLVSIFAASAFYVQTLFIVYAIFLTVFALETIVRYGKEGILRSVKLGIVTVFVNAFWILPVLYFTATSAVVPANSHINSIATPETQLMNMARSDFKDIASLKGYWFDYYDWRPGQNYDYLYKTWIGYTSQPNVIKVSLVLFFVSALGLVISLFKKKTFYGLSLLMLFGVSYFMLSGGQISWIPFFTDIFRNTFTKWANAMALIYAVGLGLFVYIISDVIRNKFKSFLGFLISLFIVGASVFSILPITKGELVADSMRLTVPSYYLDTINYFKTQDSTKRIADFPLTDFWGWKFNDWGYRGSGFLWYGIPQPMLDRAFDVWSPYNEVFFSEIFQALVSSNHANFDYVLNKYQVSYILFDESIFEPGNASSATEIQNEKNFLESSSIITKLKVFGKVTVYEVYLKGINSFMSSPQVDFSSPFVVTGQKGEAVIKETFLGSQGYQNTKNCSLNGVGSVVKTKLDKGDYYAAYDGGISCDYFYYSTLDYSKAYLMRIRGKNISGGSLKFYLYNVKSNLVDMQELLPSGDFDKSYVILPTTSVKSVGEGYTLNVETRSFGKVKSENVINSIEFYTLDDSYINSAPLIQNDLIVENVRKYSTWGYKVETSGDGLLELGQGYSDGWIAFQISNSKFQILTHLEVNSWANGWTVENSTISNPDSVIYIFYWPQLLEWGGGILGLVSLLVLFFKSKNKQNNTL